MMMSVRSKRQLLDLVGEMVKRAIATLRAIPDPEASFLIPRRQISLPVVHSVMEAYGYSTTETRYVPSAHEISEMERTMEAMAKLRHEDEPSFLRLWQWAEDKPIWQIADRENVSAKTIRNRLDQSLARLLFFLGGYRVEVEVINEHTEKAATHFLTEPSLSLNDVVMPAKVFISGVGFMLGGKRMRRRHGRHQSQ